jgi:hypothetical protein
MRTLIALVLVLISFPCFSAEVTCFSKKTRIYHGYGTDFSFHRDFIAFTESKTHHLIMTYADCIIMIPASEVL